MKQVVGFDDRKPDASLEAPHTPLRLPAPPDLRVEDGRVYDPQRGRWIILTPEEWVRQHAVQFLREKGIPNGLMAIETGHMSSSGSRRTDITVYDRGGRAWMVCECKAASVPLTQHALAQVMRYADALTPRYVAVTNGLALHVAARDTTGLYQHLSGFPAFDDS